MFVFGSSSSLGLPSFIFIIAQVLGFSELSVYRDFRNCLCSGTPVLLWSWDLGACVLVLICLFECRGFLIFVYAGLLAGRWLFLGVSRKVEGGDFFFLCCMYVKLHEVILRSRNII